MVTPDRGHPVAQQVVLGGLLAVSITSLLLTSLPPAWFNPPHWVWLLIEEAMLSLGTLYALVWVFPPPKRRV